MKQNKPNFYRSIRYHNIKALGFNNYEQYLNSEWWIIKARELLDNTYNCEICQKYRYFNNKRLKFVVHHKHYTNVGNESRKDLMVICEECHRGIHKK